MFDREMAEREGWGWLDSRLVGAEDTAPIIRDSWQDVFTWGLKSESQHNDET